MYTIPRLTVLLRYLIVCGLVGILGTTGYAVASGNTLQPNTGGDGQGGISGYAVTNVSYVLHAANPTQLAAVSFDVIGVARPAAVRVQLVSSSAVWYACSAVPATAERFTCATTLPRPTLADLDALRVVAAS
jgi:hypothetical protein